MSTQRVPKTLKPAAQRGLAGSCAYKQVERVEGCPQMTVAPAPQLDRRSLGWGLIAVLTAPLLLAGCSGADRPVAMIVHRDPGCGCCHAWASALQRSGRFDVSVVDENDMSAIKQRNGVPSELVSCHTAAAAGYVIEGHVPAQDILRLLRERPVAIKGLAVAGMPLGSPGMETPSGGRDAFDVVAFGAHGERAIYAHYAAA